MPPKKRSFNSMQSVSSDGCVGKELRSPKVLQNSLPDKRSSKIIKDQKSSQSNKMATELTNTRNTQQFSNIEKLPEQILGALLFSGYFSSAFVSKSILLINKGINDIGRRTIFALDLRALKIEKSLFFSMMTTTFTNLVYLDLGYTNITDDLSRSINFGNLNNLRGLSLRGTLISDTCVKKICKLPNLQSLDLSKSSENQANLITDVSGLDLKYATKLTWLNLSWTFITDDTIISLSKLKSLRHLGLQCCSLLSDQSLQALSSQCLLSLDISGCSRLSNQGMEYLVNLKSPIRKSLSDLNCSFLDSANEHTINQLIELPALKRFQFRKRAGQLNKGLCDRARLRIPECIFTHYDQSPDPLVDNLPACLS